MVRLLYPNKYHIKLENKLEFFLIFFIYSEIFNSSLSKSVFWFEKIKTSKLF